MSSPESSSSSSGKSFLPKTFEPTECDVICGRCGTRPNHSGNRTFRKAIGNSLKLYAAACSRRAKSIVVSDIANSILFNGDESLRFIQFCGVEFRWFELPYEAVRLKVGQALLDNTILRDPERRMQQKNAQRRCRLRRQGITSDIARKNIIPSSENVDRTSPLATTTTLRVQNNHVDGDTLASQALQQVPPSDHELRLDSSREDVAPGASSFFDAQKASHEVSTTHSGRKEEDAADANSSTSCGWFTDSEGRIYLQVWV